MAWRASLFAIVCATSLIPRAADAQEPYRRVRFSTADSSGVQHWEGFLERLTKDSLYVRFRDADSISAFSRTVIFSVERQRDIHPLRRVGIGCLAVGAALGAVGYSASRDPDSPGIEKVAGVLGFGVGCIAGGFGGLLLTAIDHDGWEPWTLPDSLSIDTSFDAQPSALPVR